MNYRKFIQDNQKRLGYKIISMNDSFVEIECNKCHAIKRMQLSSLYKNYINRKNECPTTLYPFHNYLCSKYYLDLCIKDLGEKAGRHFHDFYRYSKERCENPNCKDYKRYKGLFRFEDFPDFYLHCFPAYMEGLKQFHYSKLSIDRIDGTKGYEPGNIRFTSMTKNLQNKPNVKAVKMTNINTGEIIRACSFGELAIIFKDLSCVSAIHRAFKNNSLYLKEWKIEYDSES